jgi:hypothetical protein
LIMGIADDARDALRPSNTIEAVPTTARQAAGQAQSGRPSLATGPTLPTQTDSQSAASQGRKRPVAAVADPESITRTYYVQTHGDERRYYDDYKGSALAMRATGTAISSKRQDLNTVRAMLELAQARGWQSLEVRGSGEFKREMWIEATARGLQARGHPASDLDRQEAGRRGAERAPANTVRAQAAAAQSPAAPTAPAGSRDKTMSSAALSRDQAAGRSESEPQAPSRAGRLDPAVAQHRRTVREADKELSQDARLVLAALSEKIDRQMSRHHSETRAELKAFAAAELVKKERAEGPIVLSAAHKHAASAPEPANTAPSPARLLEPRAPQRSLSR